MKISELIIKLRELNSKIGDVPVVVASAGPPDEDPKFVEVEHLLCLNLVGPATIRSVVLVS